MSEMILRTDHLAVGYQKKTLIGDICMALKQGEILVLIGPNGAGKSTIIKSIIGQLAPVGGTAYLEEKDLSFFSRGDLAKKMASVQTIRGNVEYMTVEEVVSVGRYPYTGAFGLLSGEDKRLVQESMKLVHVEELAAQDFNCISDGQKQRVLLARALCQKPELLVLDEPTSFLDIRYKLEFLSILRGLAKEGKMSVLLSLHELDLAQKVADKIILVKGDHIAGFGTPEEIFSGDTIGDLFAIKEGYFDPLSGTAELPKCTKEASVFVLSGCGYGTPVFRKLQRQGTGFASGPLWENDQDMAAARALAERVLSVPAFEPIGDEILAKAKEEIALCDRFVVALPEEKMGGLAGPLRSLIDYAKELGKEPEYGI